MKKIVASVVGFVLASCLVVTTVSAVEHKLGGYWRTRAFVQDNFINNSGSSSVIDNRGQVYYTAKFNDDLKVVNKFEFNTAWGDDNGGDIGADGTGIWRIKNSYLDANLGGVHVKLGIQGVAIARGFIFDSDFSGVILTGKFSDNVKVPFMYARTGDKYLQKSDLPFDEDIFAIFPTIKVTDAVKVSPYLLYASGNGKVDAESNLSRDFNRFYVGVDVDVDLDNAKKSVWGTLIHCNGTLKNDTDHQGFLVAAGLKMGIAHGQAFYASGDDGSAPKDSDDFHAGPGNYYGWAEILGSGTFDNAIPTGSPGANISNLAAVNAGVTINPTDKLTIDANVWHASLVEGDANNNKDLGIEFDTKFSYDIMDNLLAEFILAYLVAGDAIGDDNVIESGLRVSLKF